MNRSKSKTFCKFWIFLLAVPAMVVQGCATTKPPPVDPLAYREPGGKQHQRGCDRYSCRTDHRGSSGDLRCRVLESGEFERLGNPATLHSDARIIAATNGVLEEEVRQGRFREDLWYRLKVFPISVPPLRDREEDIPLLVKWFVDQLI